MKLQLDYYRFEIYKTIRKSQEKYKKQARSELGVSSLIFRYNRKVIVIAAFR